MSADVVVQPQEASQPNALERLLDDECWQKIVEMRECCQCGNTLAEAFLRDTNWVLEDAIGLFYDRNCDDLAVRCSLRGVWFASATIKELATASANLSCFKKLEMVTHDVLTLWASKFALQQASFAEQHKSTRVHIGFHWTSNQHLKNISEHGLLSNKERQQSKVKSGFHGAVFGDGVYLANRPDDFSGYGDTCLVCLAMLGTHKRIYHTGKDDAVDTIIGNKGSATHPQKDEIVLKGSSQCVPVFKIRADDLKDKEFMSFLATNFKCWLQTFATKWFDVQVDSSSLEVGAPEYEPMQVQAVAASASASVHASVSVGRVRT